MPHFPSVIKDNSVYRPIPFLTRLVSVLVSVGVRAKGAKESQCSDSQYEIRSGDTLGRVLSLLGHLKFNGSAPGVFHSPELVNPKKEARTLNEELLHYFIKKKCV